MRTQTPLPAYSSIPANGNDKTLKYAPLWRLRIPFSFQIYFFEFHISIVVLIKTSLYSYPKNKYLSIAWPTYQMSPQMQIGSYCRSVACRSVSIRRIILLFHLDQEPFGQHHSGLRARGFSRESIWRPTRPPHHHLVGNCNLNIDDGSLNQVYEGVLNQPWKQDTDAKLKYDTAGIRVLLFWLAFKFNWLRIVLWNLKSTNEKWPLELRKI